MTARTRPASHARLAAALLALWTAVTFGVAFHARALTFDVFGWPFSFRVAAQGGPIVDLLRRADRSSTC